MIRRTFIAMLGIMLLAAPGRAQQSLTLTVGGGVSAPVGPLTNVADPGWNALASVGFGGPIHPWSLRLDAAHQEFARAGSAAAARPGVTSVGLGANYRLPRTNSSWSPYVTTGVGGYRVGCSGAAACEATTAAGWNTGAGLRFIMFGARGMLEARYHRVHVSGSDTQFVPITIGIIL